MYELQHKVNIQKLNSEYIIKAWYKALPTFDNSGFQKIELTLNRLIILHLVSWLSW